MANEYKYKITADSTGAGKAIDQLEAKGTKLDRKFEKLKKTTGAVFSTKNLLAATAAIGGITLAVKGLVQQASKMEDFGVQFEVLTGSATKASQIMEDLQEFAASTPFQFEGIANAAKQLLGFGFSVDEIKGKLREIGDVAAASGKPIQEISLIFGQVAAAGKLTGERLLQFQERAIPIGPAIAKTMGIAESSVKSAVTAGKVDLETFQKAFSSLSDKGGFAFEGLVKQSKTLSGAYSTLKDNIGLLAAEVGKKLTPALKTVAGALTFVAQSWTDYFKVTKKAKEETVDNTAEIAKTTAKIEELQAKLSKTPVPTTDSAKRFYDTQLGILKFYIEKKRQLEAEAKVQDEADADAVKDKALTAEDAKAAALIEREKALQAALKEVRAEDTAEIDALSAEEKQNKLNSLQEQLEAEQLLKDEAAIKALESKGEFDKALALQDSIATKKKVKTYKERIKLEQAYAKNSVDIATATSNLITAVASEGSKTAFVIAKAAAIAQSIVSTQLAAANALVVDQTGVLATRVKILGAINTATIAATAIKGLNAGGLVEGGRAGVDSVPALLTPNEVVVPANTSFADIVDAGRAIAGDDEGTESGMDVNVTVGFTDNAMEIIETQVIERRSLGISAI